MCLFLATAKATNTMCICSRRLFVFIVNFKKRNLSFHLQTSQFCFCFSHISVAAVLLCKHLPVYLFQCQTIQVINKNFNAFILNTCCLCKFVSAPNTQPGRDQWGLACNMKMSWINYLSLIFICRYLFLMCHYSQ